MNTIENLKKVTLSFQAGTTAETMDIQAEPFEITFVFGIATEGMTPFEYELAGKSSGEEISLHLKRNNYYKFFEHLYPSLWQFLNDSPELHLKAKIKNVVSADNREILKALSDATAHGGGGCDDDCGCGCG